MLALCGIMSRLAYWRRKRRGYTNSRKRNIHQAEANCCTKSPSSFLIFSPFKMAKTPRLVALRSRLWGSAVEPASAWRQFACRTCQTASWTPVVCAYHATPAAALVIPALPCSKKSSKSTKKGDLSRVRSGLWPVRFCSPTVTRPLPCSASAAASKRSRRTSTRFSSRSTLVREMRQRSFEGTATVLWHTGRLSCAETGISKKAMSIMNSFVNDTFDRMAGEAVRLAR